ncbi:Kelch repeat-containing protein [Variovorax paradoxus]|uniref:Kelch repeat type 1-containing protein n=1 Tax=Variovorax paradoxus (strain EPS) TaxID=595537 RepID=E6V3F9_VARPE|nr:kelch repeat-containing protein [Variovorax paradoxus]ADU34649.1 Kelch repeat type 1-containing protein [Variovorax paradoxus EPS]
MRGVLGALSAVLFCSLLLAGCGGGGGGGGFPFNLGGNTPEIKDFAIGGGVTGISPGGQIVLKNNGGDPLTLSADGPFSFKQRIREGANYTVSVSSTLPTQACTVVFASGVATADVASVKVVCGPAQEAVFQPAAAMLTPRVEHTLIALPDGTVLALGGQDLGLKGVTSIERYDPASNLWKSAGTLPFQSLQAAVFLPSSGKVLVVGTGAGSQLYDPATQAFTPSGGFVTLATVRQLILLLDGRVLASDGNLVELYRPDTGVWRASATASMDHQGGAFTLMANGKILVSGGLLGGTIADSEVFDPSTEKWTTVGRLATSRSGHRGVLLSTGKVLAVGGATGTVAHACSCGLRTVAQAELFDPSTNMWSSAGSLLVGRNGFSSTLMPTGRVLVAGGSIQGEIDQSTQGFRRTIPSPLSNVEVYDPLTNMWQSWGTLLAARSGHSASLMSSGKLLLSGGSAANPDNPTNPDPYAWHIEFVTSSEIGW